jgi:hypothetical protein
MTRKALAILFLSALPVLGGCTDWIKMAAILFAPEHPTKKVEAGYKGLDKHSLAIVVYHNLRVQYEYPSAREWVTKAIAERFDDKEVRKKIESLHVVPPGATLRYQEEHLHWDELDRTQLGKALGADYVLFVTLTEFTTREPASTYQLQGLITAEVSLYKTDAPERASRVYRGEDIRVLNPKNTPGGMPGYDDRQIREDMIKEFAEKVVWKFYDHEEPEDET